MLYYNCRCYISWWCVCACKCIYIHIYHIYIYMDTHTYIHIWYVCGYLYKVQTFKNFSQMGPHEKKVCLLMGGHSFSTYYHQNICQKRLGNIYMCKKHVKHYQTDFGASTACSSSEDRLWFFYNKLNQLQIFHPPFMAPIF